MVVSASRSTGPGDAWGLGAGVYLFAKEIISANLGHREAGLGSPARLPWAKGDDGVTPGFLFSFALGIKRRAFANDLAN